MHLGVHQERPGEVHPVLQGPLEAQSNDTIKLIINLISFPLRSYSVIKLNYLTKLTLIAKKVRTDMMIAED